MKSEIYQPSRELADSLDIQDDFKRKCIDTIIETYELKIKELRTQFKLQQYEHYQERMEDYHKFKLGSNHPKKDNPPYYPRLLTHILKGRKAS